MEEYIKDPIFVKIFGHDLIYYLLKHKPEKNELIKNIIISTKGRNFNKKLSDNIVITILKSNLSNKDDILNTLIKYNPSVINRKGVLLSRLTNQYKKYFIQNKFKCDNWRDLHDVINYCDDNNIINMVYLFNRLKRGYNFVDKNSTLNINTDVPKSTLKCLIILFLKRKIKSGHYYFNDTIKKPSKRLMKKCIYFPDNFPFILAVYNKK